MVIKSIYSIYDTKSSQLGDLVIFGSDDEAKRFYVNNLAIVSPVIAKDLVLVNLSNISFYDDEIVDDSKLPFVSARHTDFVFSYDDVKDEVQNLVEYNLKLRTLSMNLGNETCSKKFLSEVSKLDALISAGEEFFSSKKKRGK